MARLPSLPRVGAVLLLAIAAAALRPSAAHAQRAPGDTLEVLSVEFSGADAMPEELLRSAIVTAPTRCRSVALQPLCVIGVAQVREYLDLRELAADVFRLRVFYYQRGFRDAAVALDTTRTAGGMHVRFRVSEGRPVRVRSVTLQGETEAGGRLARGLPIRAGEPFSVLGFEASRDSLVARLANRGYASADVLANYLIPADEPYQADVEFQLIPGLVTHFGPVEVVGTERVSPAVVRRMLVFREGDRFSRQALARSQRNLFNLDVFRHAEITVGSALPGDSVLPIRVQVNEGDVHRVRLGAGMSTSDFTSVEGLWTSRNFLGRARRLELRGRLSNLLAGELGGAPLFEDCTGIYCDIAGSVAVDFSQPWFFSPLNTLGLGIFAERFTLPDVYVRSSRGAYFSLQRTVGAGGLATIGYRPELTSLESEGDLIFCVNFVACQEREIDVLREPNWLAPLAASFVIDRSNSLFAPTAGYIVRLETEYGAAATGSDFDYVRVLGELSHYHDPFRGVVIASRLRPGWARAIDAPERGLGLHPQKRFFAGGPNSVRGFAQYRLGPKLLTVAADTLVQPVSAGGAGCTAQEVNAGTCDAGAFAREHPGALMPRPVGGAVSLEGNIEVRFPIWTDRLRGAAFLDFGQVWSTHRDVQARDLEWTPGFGVRLLSPVGPIRVDVGYNPGGAEQLTVLTTELCYRPAGAPACSDILPGETYAPEDLENRRQLRTLAPVMWQPYESFTDRLQFHFSIGQAF